MSKRISFCLLTASSPLLANPAGGDVVGGSATIDYGTTTVITQHTDKAIVNWQDFSINENETTQFVQPSSSSVILNRVVGGNASQIMGRLQSNGTIFLVNPNGIVFGKDAVVDVGGLVASTASISNQHFMEGNYHFTDAPDHTGVVNEGRITVAQSGYAVLVAPNVVNSGIIDATLGEVVLASGKAFTVDLYGDNLITLDATALVEGAQVKNSGIILADGGKITMTAAAADSLVESLINMDGYVQARTVGHQHGKIALLGNENTNITIAGKIDVSGKDADETGGVIQATGHYLKMTSGAELDASGDAGGGTVHIGSDTFHNPGDPKGVNTFGGLSSLATAQYVYGSPDTVINANAINRGDGGSVVVWADQSTWYYGGISAAAKGLEGSGGRVETSGYYLDIAGIKVDTSAISGSTGIWLLDPAAITISATAPTAGGTFSGGSPNTFTPTVDTVTAILNGADISAALLTNNVIISTGGGLTDYDITFDSTFDNTNPITWATANSLTLLASGSIIFNAVSATDNVMSITGGGTVNLRSNTDADSTGTVTVTNGRINASTTAAQVNIFYNPSAYTTPTDYSSLVTGTATQTAYMLVNTATELQALNTNLTGNYALNTDIDVDGTFPDFTSIGGEGSTFFAGRFIGSILGTQYTISDLIISAAGLDGVGLFGKVSSGATLTDIRVSNATVTGANFVGGIVGAIDNATMTGTYSLLSGTITGLVQVGGLVGSMHTATVFSATSASTSAGVVVTSAASDAIYIGGLFGVVTDSITSFSASGSLTNNATVSATSAAGETSGIGGIFGVFIKSGLTISSTMINTGTVFAGTSGGASPTINPDSANIGGIAGSILGSTFTGSFTNSGHVSGGSFLGGLIGHMTGGSISGSADFKTTAGTITGGNYTGGLVGTFGANGSFVRTGSTNISTSVGVIVSGTGTLGGGISGLFASVNGGGTGTFTPAGSGTLTNNATVTGAGVMTGGGIFGHFLRAGTNAYDMTNASTGVVTDFGGVGIGGIVGNLNGAIFSGTLNSYADILGAVRVGGIAGSMIDATLSGNVTYGDGAAHTLALNSSPTHQHLGGIVGIMQGTSGITGTATIANGVSYVANDVNQNIGGIIGLLNTGTATLTATFTNKSVAVSKFGSPGGVNVGGYIGKVDIGAGNTVTVNFGNAVTVSGYDTVGGVAGLIASGTLAGTLSNAAAITSTTSNAGGVLGSVTGGTITASLEQVSGTIQAATNAGGVIGSVSGGTITPSLLKATAGTVTATTAYAGAVIGSLASTNIGVAMSSLAGVTVTSANGAGGLIGRMTGTSQLNAVATTAEMNSAALFGVSTSVGGIVGVLEDTAILNTTGVGFIRTSVIAATSTYVGGYVGEFLNATYSGSLSALANVFGGDYTGGIAGLFTSGTITGSFSSGKTVAGDSYVGGLIGGTVGGTISGSADFKTTAGSAVSGIDYVGSLIGEMGADTSFTRTGAANMFSTGSVAGSGDIVGGLMGAVQGGGTGTFTPATSGTLTNNATVAGVNYTGGLFGQYNRAGTNAYNFVNAASGDVTSTNGSFVGGIMGVASRASSTLTFTGDMFNAGDVSNGTGSTIGGISGALSNTVSTAVFFSGNLNNTGNITTSGANYAAGIAGYVGSGVDFRNVTTDSVISNTGNIIAPSTDFVAGLFGRLEVVFINGTLSSSATTIQGRDFVGGLIGFHNNGFGSTTGIFGGDFIVNPSSIAIISGRSIVGGQIGWTTSRYTPDTITMSSNLTVSATSDIVGGLIGSTDGVGFGFSLPVNYNNVVTVYAPNSQYVGGIIGIYTHPGDPALEKVSNSASVTGSSIVGGILGRNFGTLDQAAMTSGTVTGETKVGGIVGENVGTVSNALFGATLVAAGASPDMLGGIVGDNTGGIITNTLSVPTMTVGSATNVGALVGDNTGGTINTSYYDTRKYSTAVGMGTTGGVGYGTDVEFYTQSSYVGFSFPTIWTLTGTQYYAAPTFCSPGCKISLGSPSPTPTPTNPTTTLSSQTLAAITQVIASTQATNATSSVSTISSSNLASLTNWLGTFNLPPAIVNKIYAALKHTGLSRDLLARLILINFDDGSDTSEHEIAFQRDVSSIIAMLTEYYDSNSCIADANRREDEHQPCKYKSDLLNVGLNAQMLKKGHAIQALSPVIVVQDEQDSGQEYSLQFFEFIDALSQYYLNAARTG